MSFITIDDSKCKKDFHCVGECPSALIRMKSKKEIPQAIPDADKYCIRCGHCVAVCPHGALEHRELPLAECPEIKEDLMISDHQVVQFIRSRRSVRRFGKQPVKRETIETLISVVRYAPSAGNGQPVEWTVVTDKNDLQTIAGLTVDWLRKQVETQPEEKVPVYLPAVIAEWDSGRDGVLRNAPALVIGSAHADHKWGMVDVTIAMTTMELATAAFGMAGCWAGFVQGALDNWAPLKEFIGLPAGHTYQIPMMIGYSKYQYYRLPERKQPKIFWK